MELKDATKPLAERALLTEGPVHCTVVVLMVGVQFSVTKSFSSTIMANGKIGGNISEGRVSCGRRG